MSKTFVLVNPASANGRTGKRWPELAAALRKRVGEIEVCFTDGPLQAPHRVREALRNGADLVVSVGGDGTHNEVVNGFFDAKGPIRPQAALSIVPAGTGGDLRRTLGLPLDPLAAIEQVGRDPREVDVGRLTCTGHDGNPLDHWFINITSFGIAGLVDKLVNESSKALGGKLSFLWGVARAAARYRNQPIRFSLDGGELKPLTINNFVVANGRYFGGGMFIAPEADMSDGLFDIVILGDLGTVDIARGLPRLYKGQHLSIRGIEHTRAREVRAEPVDPEARILIDMDGEQPGRLPATLRLHPRALRLCFGT
jgi:YegS/Rv2252/BmrU family lipid kinase